GIGGRPKLRTEPKCNAWTLTRNAPFRLNYFFALNENLVGLAPQVPSKADGNIHEPWTRMFWPTYLTAVPIRFMAAYEKRPCRRGCCPLHPSLTEGDAIALMLVTQNQWN